MAHSNAQTQCQVPSIPDQLFGPRTPGAPYPEFIRHDDPLPLWVAFQPNLSAMAYNRGPNAYNTRPSLARNLPAKQNVAAKKTRNIFWDTINIGSFLVALYFALPYLFPITGDFVEGAKQTFYTATISNFGPTPPPVSTASSFQSIVSKYYSPMMGPNKFSEKTKFNVEERQSSSENLPTSTPTGIKPDSTSVEKGWTSFRSVIREANSKYDESYSAEPAKGFKPFRTVYRSANIKFDEATDTPVITNPASMNEKQDPTPPVKGWASYQRVYRSYNSKRDESRESRAATGTEPAKGWPSFRSVYRSYNSERDEERASKAEPANGWPSFQSVYRSYNKERDESSKTGPAKGWPSLQSVYRSYNSKRDERSATEPAKGWPSFQSVYRSHNSKRDEISSTEAGPAKGWAFFRSVYPSHSSVLDAKATNTETASRIEKEL